MTDPGTESRIAPHARLVIDTSVLVAHITGTEVVSEVERQSGTAAFERRASSGGALGLRLNEEGALTQVVSHP